MEAKSELACQAGATHAHETLNLSQWTKPLLASGKWRVSSKRRLYVITGTLCFGGSAAMLARGFPSKTNPTKRPSCEWSLRRNSSAAFLVAGSAATVQSFSCDPLQVVTRSMPALQAVVNMILHWNTLDLDQQSDCNEPRTK